MKHMFIIMYKLGLIKRTNATLCSMLTKEAKVHVNICDWDLKIHHVVWVYNTTYKTTIMYSPFHLIYEMETLVAQVDAPLSSLLDPLEGLSMLNCGKLELKGRFRLPALKGVRRAC
jgi:hypothetical protein